MAVNDLCDARLLDLRRKQNHQALLKAKYCP